MITLQRSKLYIMLPTENIVWHTKHKYTQEGMDAILTTHIYNAANHSISAAWLHRLQLRIAILGKIILRPGFIVSFIAILGKMMKQAIAMEPISMIMRAIIISL